MKNAIILHGGPSKKEYYDPEAPSMSNAHWIPWLQGQLLKADIATAAPEVPHSFDRNWKVWNREVERFEIGPDTILIGHSTGAGFFVKYLSIHKDLKVNKVILVAPWLDPDHEHTKNFFDDFEIDPNFVSRTAGVTIFNSDNDQTSVLKTVRILRDKIKNIGYKEFHNYGYFTFEDMKTAKFPELLETIQKAN
ncbi:alpha/beta hydrolase [Candidatus Gottesmanbacteria bacterium]|nr:alpha/beta hydrolase [Candidatus Gottesmanbacteria bacterium]